MARRRIGLVFRIPESQREQILGISRALGNPGAGVMEPHITIASPSSFSKSEISALLIDLGRILSDYEPFAIRIGGSGCFRGEKNVLFLEVDPDPILFDFAEVVHSGFDSSPRSFDYVPHVTLYDFCSLELIELAKVHLSGYRSLFMAEMLSLFVQNSKGSWSSYCDISFGGVTKGSQGGQPLTYLRLGSSGAWLDDLFDGGRFGMTFSSYGFDLLVSGLHRGRGHSLVAFSRERPVGFITGYSSGALMVVDGIYVVENERGFGLSAGLFDQLVLFSRQSGARALVGFFDCKYYEAEVVASIFRGRGGVECDPALLGSYRSGIAAYSLNLANL
ncbi:2'-5' RNA ligase family protein [Acidithrix ferrooxidans]|uniref:Uncharacterized protein n=1 Tax=Acidithrix ferrooxidans TaxID=1280514 RepID=A0A0D8HHI3_9ACTN|nr:2'-5' RNA ligase family protein [Acidithrix ferrooxidans]KJF17247.1 hypothetical protein AXFE_18800 [Acidithrix ferrooxidans]